MSERLADWTTLRLGGPVDSFIQASTRDELYDAVAARDDAGEPVLVLGGGSNLVVADDGFPGAVVQVASVGVEVATAADSADGADAVEVTVESGESWDRFVAWAVSEGWVGVEALAGIPGSVGAVPIQNVGAYGQEVSQTLVAVHCYDRRERRRATLAAADCDFGYRTSLFKKHPGRYVVGAVNFRFSLGTSGAPVEYDQLARALDVDLGQQAPASDVRRAVLRLRSGKGMVLDPSDHDTWSAGSFFTNPVVTASAVPEGAPAWPHRDGQVKTSAAWLIDQAGFGKGYGNDRVSLSTKHTLALTNRGSATTADLVALAAELRAGVRERFGLTLQPEPTLVNCALPD
ncbi:MAG: UDP-N-acetylmuramate dehydrogenase [Nocardioidaceae bacterium]